jgi:putative hydrolase of the HAD superfamily
LLQQKHPFDQHGALLIDDSLAVLHAARQFGIRHLVSVSKSDTRLPKKMIIDYPAIEDFRELMTGL